MPLLWNPFTRLLPKTMTPENYSTAHMMAYIESISILLYCFDIVQYMCITYKYTIRSKRIPRHVIPSLLRVKPYSTTHVLYCTVHAKTEQHDRSFLKQFCCHIHSSWELVTLGIKNSLQPKQLSKCLPRRHPQKHYNLNKTYVLTLLSPVVTRLLSYLLHRILLIGWSAGCSVFIPSKLVQRDILQNHS